MTEPAPVHGFIALELPRRSIEGLHGVQRAIRTMAEGAELIPWRLLCLPLVDLGSRQVEIFEAAELALERATTSAQPLDIVFTGVETWPKADPPRLVRAMVDDDDGRFGALRDAVFSSKTTFFHIFLVVPVEGETATASGCSSSWERWRVRTRAKSSGRSMLLMATPTRCR